MAKTRDGLKIPKIVRLLQGWQIEIRDGTNHPYIARYPNMRPCPIAESTDGEKMLSPWLSQALNRPKREIYAELKTYC